MVASGRPRCAPYWSRIYTFECQNPETWQSGAAGGASHAHAMARAPGAIDAVCLMYTNSQDDEGVDAAAYRQLDASTSSSRLPARRPPTTSPRRSRRSNMRCGRRRWHVRGGVRRARPNADHVARDDPLHRREGVDHQNPGRPAEPCHGGDHLPQFRAARSAAMGRGGEGLRARGSEESSTSSP